MVAFSLPFSLSLSLSEALTFSLSSLRTVLFLFSLSLSFSCKRAPQKLGPFLKKRSDLNESLHVSIPQRTHLYSYVWMSHATHVHVAYHTDKCDTWHPKDNACRWDDSFRRVMRCYTVRRNTEHSNPAGSEHMNPTLGYSRDYVWSDKHNHSHLHIYMDHVKYESESSPMGMSHVNRCTSTHTEKCWRGKRRGRGRVCR